MSLPDYHIHLNSDQFSRLWENDEEEEGHPFGEDQAEIDRIIEEEIGKPRRSRRNRQPRGTN